MADGNDPKFGDPTSGDPGSGDTGSGDTGSGGTGFAGARQRTTGTPVRRGGPDPLSLVVGLLALGLAVASFTGTAPDLSGLEARWLLAGGAALVGLLLLTGSLRGRRG